MIEFKKWFEENLGECAGDIVACGADCGWPLITCNSDGADIFDKFSEEIWERVLLVAEDMGENPLVMISKFGRADMAETDFTCFKTLLVWFACEEIAREVVESKEEEESDKGMEAGTRVAVSSHTSEPGTGTSYPAFQGELLEYCNGMGWDVVDIKLDSGETESVYSFDVRPLLPHTINLT